MAIVDFGMGNLFSAKHACEHVGMKALITPRKSIFCRADAVILPGVGAFGDAMNSLHKLDLVGTSQGRGCLRKTYGRYMPGITVTDDREPGIRSTQEVWEL